MQQNRLLHFTIFTTYCISLAIIIHRNLTATVVESDNFNYIFSFFFLPIAVLPILQTGDIMHVILKTTLKLPCRGTN